MGRERVLYWPETYRNIKEIGRGVSGVVYKAAHKETGQLVAIKLVDMNQNKVSSEQVQGEIRALLTLNPEKEKPHKNIIKLIECFVHKTTAIFILEYVDGGTLEDFMYTFDQGLPLNLASHILYQTISAIEFMNGKKCSHRDIKPANILLLRNKTTSQRSVDGGSSSGGGGRILNSSNEGYGVISSSFDDGNNGTNYRYLEDEPPILKITDYGYASIDLNENEIHSTLAGSPLYMAPEIIHIILSPFLEQKTGKLSPEANEGYNPLLVDIWAIGAVAFRLVTGHELINAIFPNLNQSTVLSALVSLAKMVDNNEFQRGIDIIPTFMMKCGVKDLDCISFIKSLLQLDPRKRITLADALQHPFLQPGKKSFEKTLKDFYGEDLKDSVTVIPSDISDLIVNNNSSSSNCSSSNGSSLNNSHSDMPNIINAIQDTLIQNREKIQNSINSEDLNHHHDELDIDLLEKKINSINVSLEKDIMNQVDNNNNNNSKVTTTTTTTTTKSNNNNDLSSSISPPTSASSTQTKNTHNTTTIISKESNSPISGSGSKWSSSLPKFNRSASQQTFLSHQRNPKLFKLFPKLLPPPTKDTPPLDTMTWRSPPVYIEDNITWTMIAQDAIFQVQFGVLTSILKVLSASEAYQFRIITQTANPLEIAVSNHRDSILYMYNIVQTIVTPQLISLSSSFDENSIYNALVAILHQISQEQEHEEFISAWMVVE